MESHQIAREANRTAICRSSISIRAVPSAHHIESRPKHGEPYWRRCRYIKYQYVYKENTSRQVSENRRSWGRADQRAQEIRASLTGD